MTRPAMTPATPGRGDNAQHPRFHTTTHFACGHERTPENTYKRHPEYYRRKDRSLRVTVYEFCRACQLEKVARKYQEKKERAA